MGIDRLFGSYLGLFRLLETKDRIFGEIGMLFANKVPARKFAKHSTDLYNESAPMVEEIKS